MVISTMDLYVQNVITVVSIAQDLILINAHNALKMLISTTEAML